MTAGEPNAAPSPTPDPSLLARWTETVLAAGTHARPDIVEAAGQDLLRRWGAPQRHYHATPHLREVLAALDLIVRDDPVHPRAQASAELAAWFHDAVYDPTASDNEERSAQLAAFVLTALGVSCTLVAEVAQLIRATAGHEDLASTAAGRALHDADLWILGSPTARFDEYCREVRREYAAVPDRDYGPRRRAVLRPFLVADPLYLTPAAAPWQAAARENLRREIDRLPQA